MVRLGGGDTIAVLSQTALNGRVPMFFVLQRHLLSVVHLFLSTSLFLAPS